MLTRRKWLTVLAAASLPAQSKPNPLVILMGAPGSGKSTIAGMISKRYECIVIDAAQLAQQNRATLEKHRNKALANMELVEDPGMNAIVQVELEKALKTTGVVLDGYPNTKFQADFLTQLRRDGRIPPVTVIQLDAPDDVIKQRLAGSAKPEQIEQRIKDFRRELDNAALYYPEARIVRVDSNRTPKATFADVVKAIEGK